MLFSAKDIFVYRAIITVHENIRVVTLDQMIQMIHRVRCKNAANVGDVLSASCKLFLQCETCRPLKPSMVSMNTVTLNCLLFQELIPSYLKPMQVFTLWQGTLCSNDSRPDFHLTQLCHLDLEFSGNHLPLENSYEKVCRTANCKIRNGKLQRLDCWGRDCRELKEWGRKTL